MEARKFRTNLRITNKQMMRCIQTYYYPLQFRNLCEEWAQNPRRTIVKLCTLNIMSFVLKFRSLTKSTQRTNVDPTKSLFCSHAIINRSYKWNKEFWNSTKHYCNGNFNITQFVHKHLLSRKTNHSEIIFKWLVRLNSVFQSRFKSDQEQ